MKKIVYCILILSLISCSFKDKNGNAPLIEDFDGKLIDNPDYMSDEQYERKEKQRKERQESDENFKDLSSNMKKWADSVNKKPMTKPESIQHVKTVEMMKNNFNK